MTTPTTDQVVEALKRLTREVGFMLEAPTKELIVSYETQAAFDEAWEALKEIGVTITKCDE